MMLPLTPDEGVTEAPESGALEAPRAEGCGNHHPVSIRLNIPFFTRRYYLTVIAGKEQRSTERLAEEREKQPLTTTANMIFPFTVGFVLGGSCWIGLQAMATWLWRVVVT